LNEHVVSNACVACPSVVANVEGDDASGKNTECDGDACSSDFRVLNNACVPCESGRIRLAGDDPRGDDTSCSLPPPPPPPSVDLEALKSDASVKIAKAAESRDAMLANVTDEKAKKKARVLADAAIAGAVVTKIQMSLAAASEDAACDVAFEKMRLDPSLGACDISLAARRRRRLAQMNYDVAVFLSAARVNEESLNAALSALRTEGIAATTKETDALVELRAIPGVSSSALATFGTDAVAAAEASVALQSAEKFVAANTPPPSPPPSPPSPPPPSPPPNRLIADYESSATRLGRDFATRLFAFAAAVELLCEWSQ
jgi:hypothetical protein